jgi:predicted O-methyltransferase YrrM
MYNFLLKPYYTYRYLQSRWSKLLWLYKTEAPFSVYKSDYLTYLQRWHIKKLAPKVDEFKKRLNEKQFSTDWFSPNIPQWILAFQKTHTDFSKPIKVLEIGSFEGMSALFILETFPNCHLTCADTWQGAAEHHDKTSPVFIEDFSTVVMNKFDFNLRAHKNRVAKFRGNSFQFLSTLAEDARFDLMYIDGSHDSEDVIYDAFLGFKHLNKGGIMIFDDYFWGDFYKNPMQNPAGAINSFLKIKQGEYRLIAVYGQLIIQKC